MTLFQSKPAIDIEWQQLLKQEEKFLQKRIEKKESLINQKLEEKVPEKLKGTLDTAFAKAFALILKKGTGIIEKTYKRDEIHKDYQIQQYTHDLKQDRKSLRAITKRAGQSGTKNLVVSGAMGLGMGALGIGLPDIPIFVGMILKSIYEMALRYGYDYDSEKERAYILLLIQGAVSYGEAAKQIDRSINTYIETRQLIAIDSMESQIKKTAAVLSNELLYMKFLQGIPIVGVVGGAYDAIYMKRITAYAQLKYKHRYLYDQKKNKK